MTTWADFLADLRSDLFDTNAKPRWDDKALFTYTKDAIRDYSMWFPLRVDQAELTLSGTAYPLPVDFVTDVTLECPEERFLERRQEAPGRQYGTSSRPNYYFIVGGSLYLDGSPSDGEKVLLTYHATHPVPASETDTTFVLTIPDRDIELPRIYAKAKAIGQVRSKQALLDRYDPGSGRRDDNPLLPEASVLMAEYREKIAERMPTSVVHLYRKGRMK